MKLNILLMLLFAFIAIGNTNCTAQTEKAEAQKKKDSLAGTIEGLLVDNLMTEKLELVENTEVVVTYLEIPANTTLPKHWHPGEEFVYVLEGSVTVWQKDKPDIVLNKGDVYKIPLKQVHTAMTSDVGAKGIVFRVHEEGQPARFKAE